MRNLLLFIARYHAFFVFLLLELICFFLIYQNNFYHRTLFVNSANEVAGNFYLTLNNVQNYFRLKKVNDSLLHENTRLRTRLRNLKVRKRVLGGTQEVNSFYIRSTDSSRHGSLPDSLQRYDYISARVINNSVDQVNNYLTLDKGRSEGIDVKMGVISSKGVVGIVKDVSTNFSTVLSILHTDVRISAKLKDNNFFGSIQWQGKNPNRLVLEDIPSYADVKKGDTVVTTGYSSIFPPRIMIGRVVDFRAEAGSGFYEIEVELATDMHQLKYVYVIDYLYKTEQLQLETELEHD